MTPQIIITLILAYGTLGAICFMVGLMIGANSRTRQEERHEYEGDDPRVTTVYQRDKRSEI